MVVRKQCHNAYTPDGIMGGSLPCVPSMSSLGTGSFGDTRATVNNINGQQCICGIATTEFRKCLTSFKDTEYTAMLRKSKQTLNAIKKSSNDPAIIEALKKPI